MPSSRNRSLSFTVIGALAFLITTASPAAAPPGDLDPTFDGDGKVTTDFGNAEAASGVAVQADGKIVAVGSAVVSGVNDFALARYNPDGSLDPTFDGDGKVTTDFGDDDQARAVAIQTDGKIVAAGCVGCLSSASNFALARYNADGSLDPSFDGDGKVTTDFLAAVDLAQAVVIQADGKIVAAGCVGCLSSASNFALARYNPDGSLDPTLDIDGEVVTDFGGTVDQAFGAAIDASGKIVAAGVAFGDEFGVVRYNTDGSLDPSFDADGKVATDIGGSNDVAFSVAIQGDGKIMAAGRAFVSGNDDFALVRYNADGSLDPGLDADGKATTDFSGSTDEARGVAIQGDGSIVTAGRFVAFPTSDFALARYRTDGSLDPVFSGDGKVTTDFAGTVDRAFAVAIQGDGKIVAAGFAGDNFALARYTVCRRTSRPMSIPFCP